MSIKININKLTYEDRVKIDKELELEIKGNKYNGHTSRYIYPYQVKNDVLYSPFAYTVQTLKHSRPARKKYPQMNTPFTGELREDQRKLKSEAIKHLNDTGSVIVSAHVGYGKCLGFNTPVMMYNGNIKPVQDILLGDILMGDDSTPRNVLSIARGEEQMFEICQDNGINYTANESHILSLVMKNNIDYSMERNMYHVADKYFKTMGAATDYIEKIGEYTFIDIPISEYLSLPGPTKTKLYAYKRGVNFSKSNTTFDPYTFGTWLVGDNCNMFLHNYGLSNRYIPDNYKYNSIDVRKAVLAGIIDMKGYHGGNGLYRINTYMEDIVWLSRSLGFITTTDGEFSISIQANMTIPVRHHKNIHTFSQTELNMVLYNFIVKPIYDTKSYYGFTLNGNGRFLLGDFTVTHNTACAINFATTISMKTLIIVNKIVLLEQWRKSIQKFCPEAVVKTIKPKDTQDLSPEDGDFFLVNAINVPKMVRKQLEFIGLCIVDEAHQIMADRLSLCMNYISPRYLIGLTATPYRPDGLDVLLDIYFGEYKICRELNRPHTVYTIDTGFTPKMKTTETGELNWSAILDSQANDKNRNQLIVDIISRYKDKNFLVLTKRVSQAKWLHKHIPGSEVLISTKKDFNTDTQVLIGTVSKIGTGFDFPKLNALILAADVEEFFIQILGRVMRCKDEPLVFDLVDNNPVMRRHYQTRRDIYKKHGGVMKNEKLL